MEENIQPIQPNKKRIAFDIFNFNASYVAPTYKYNKKLNYIEWGSDKMSYPKFLLNLYNNIGASRHKAIINLKSQSIAGKGFEDIVDENLKKFVEQDEFVFETQKFVLDCEIFGGGAFEVIYNNDSTLASIKHIPFHKLAIGIETEEYKFPHLLYSNNWEQYKKEEYSPELIRQYNPKIKVGKQIYYYTEYNPETDGLYPIANYITGEYMNYAELSYEISKFRINEAKQGYSAGYMLSLQTGIPTEEEQEEFAKEFKRKFASTDNTGNVIITYSEGADQKPELTPIPTNDNHEKFIGLKDTIEEALVAGHNIPPQLIVLTPGKLGATDERKELMQEFQERYITPKQENAERVINKILGNVGYTEKLKLKQFNEEIAVTSSTKEEDARAELRGSVGGVTALLTVQQSVAAGTTDRDSAIALIELIYGMSPIDANRLLGNVKEGDAAVVAQQLKEINNKL